MWRQATMLLLQVSNVVISINVYHTSPVTQGGDVCGLCVNYNHTTRMLIYQELAGQYRWSGAILNLAIMQY